MIKKIIQFISSANQVLLFIAIIAAIILIPGLFIEYDNEPNRVGIIQHSEEEPIEKNVVYTKEFKRRIEDVLIFAIHSEVIDMEASHRTGTNVILKEEKHFGANYSYNSDNTVNLLFVSEGNPSLMLFQNDRLIVDTEFVRKNIDHQYDSNLDKNLYSVVDEDSNGDGYLGDDDTPNLYCSDYNGQNVHLILKGISEFKLIDENKVLITVGEENQKRFHIYNVKTDKLILLDTKL